MRTIRLPMTPLRQRMLEDMQLRNYSPLTIDCYLRCVADFARHFGTSPEHLGPEQVRTYQLFLVQDKQVSWPSVVQTVCALRFFYRITLGRPGRLEYIPHPHRPFTLPTILSQAEVAVLLTASPILTAHAWSSGCAKAKASTIGMSCCHRSSCRCYGSIGSSLSRGLGSFPATLGHAP